MSHAATALTATDRAKLEATGAIRPPAPVDFSLLRQQWADAVKAARAAFVEAQRAEAAYIAATVGKPARDVRRRVRIPDPYRVPGSR